MGFEGLEMMQTVQNFGPDETPYPEHFSTRGMDTPLTAWEGIQSIL